MSETPPVPEHTAKTPGVRALLRRTGIAAREALPPAEHALRSARIETGLMAMLGSRSPAIIGFCWPIRAEFDARPLIERLLQSGWRACLPVLVGVAEPMSFRAWTPGAQMAVDRYGIHYPAAGEALVPDILLMPVNAFDDRGFRIGYGGGYFDRTLAALTPRPLAIGVGFDLARVASIYPEAHDVSLDAVITESGVEFFA
jgi:5,10-methenyltetrahydrofolate synthetase